MMNLLAIDSSIMGGVRNQAIADAKRNMHQLINFKKTV